MIFIIDGLQQSGKSTLISYSKLTKYRFPFDKINSDFNFNEQELNGFQIGKDLGILEFLKFVKKDLILDRGPFATLYYSLKLNRWENFYKTSNLFFRYLKQYNCCYILIEKINDTKNKVRNKNDGFDFLNDNPNDVIFYNRIKTLFEQNNIKLNIFKNDFSKSIKENSKNFNDFLKRLKDEYNRNLY